MPTVSDYLAMAIEYQQVGRLSDAEPMYRMILDEQPGNADAMQLLGVTLSARGEHEAGAGLIARAIALDPGVLAYHQNLGNVLQEGGRYAESVLCYRRAIQIDPQIPEPYNSLGNAFIALGRLDDALACFMEALRLRPSYPEVYHNLARLLSAKGQSAEAAECCRQSLRLQPNQPLAWSNLGSTLLEMGKPGEAVSCFQEAVRQKPDFLEALNNLGTALQNLGRMQEAAESYQRALCLKPDYTDALNNIATVWREMGHPEEAETDLRQAIHIQPNCAQYHTNLGSALEDQNRFDEAAGCYGDALRLNPQNPEILTSLGNTLGQTGDVEQALACYQQALACQPDFAEAHFARGLTWLRQGDFERGWPGYEWRWGLRDAPTLPFTEPRWDGSADLSGKRIFVFAEQGLGDTIQFVRYAPLLKAKGATVIVECQRMLLPLLQSAAGVDEWVAYGDTRPAFDFQVPLQSLPGLMGTKLETIPGGTPYLQVAPELVEQMHTRIPEGSAGKRTIGLAWAGNRKHRDNRRRSISPEYFEPLSKVPDTALFSLQFGPQAELGLPALLAETDMALEDAAVLMNVDLVITADTMMAHLAGALGRPVWVLLPFLPDWRWMLNRPDTPWYPSMRLFRQPRPGDWEAVIRDVVEALSHADNL